MVSTRSSTGTPKQESSFKKKLHPKKIFSHGNASRIDDLWVFQVTVSDPDGFVLDLDQILMVDFEHGTVQSVNTRWDETIMAMKKHTEEEMLVFFCR